MLIKSGVFVKFILQNLGNRKKRHNIYLFCLRLKYSKNQSIAYVPPVQKAIIDFLTRPASIAKTLSATIFSFIFFSTFHVLNSFFSNRVFHFFLIKRSSPKITLFPHPTLLRFSEVNFAL